MRRSLEDRSIVRAPVARGRRAALAEVGALLAGALALVLPGAARADGPCSDNDPSDPAGHGRHCPHFDSDTSDPAGCVRPCSDADPADPAGAGRHC